MHFFKSKSNLQEKENNTRVSVTVTSQNEIETLASNLKKDESCVVWYFGTNGLKQGAVDFYKPLLTSSILNGATPFLVDLTAWNAFKNERCKITGSNSLTKQISNDQIRILKTCDVFNALLNIKLDQDEFNLIQQISERKNLLEPSENFEKTGITLGNIFNNKCPSIASLYQLDCANSYSIIQYIEFLFLVESVLKESPKTETIKFILPNDEAKYYLSSMSDDLNSFLSARGVNFNQLKINIECFKYSDQLHHRPYNAPTKLASKKLSSNDIVDFSKIEEALHSNDDENNKFKFN